MHVAAGTRLGPYEIVAPLAAGGMGEVFKARDTRLDRSVAIKILPAGFAANEQFRLRFEREARTISQLNHPNICTLHDVGRDNGIDYLVMELIEGESLADRLSRGPLPISETLKLGAQIAGALDRAHRAGIVHRDLKPGNVMLTKSGVKLLDFGLAKTQASGLGPRATEGATEHKPLTEEGTILGTFQYMAPEQLEGIEADARTDIFSLGAVLYEMATGKRAFDGKTKTSLIAAIVASEPRPISEIQPLTPPAFEHVVQKCLAKDREDRWQSAHDVAEQLRWLGDASGKNLATRKATSLWAWSAAAVLLATTVALALLLRRERAQSPTTPVYSSLLAPSGAVFVFESAPMAMSPDGRAIAFVVRRGTEKPMLWVHDLTSNVASGSIETLIQTGPAGEGGSWNRDGTILFAPYRAREILRIQVGSSEAPRPVTARGSHRTVRYPVFLPDDHHFLFLAQGAMSGDPKSGIYLGSLDSTETTFLFRSNASALYAPPGWILHWDAGRLRAVGFDPAKLRLTGETFTVADNVQFNPGSHAGHYSVSSTGNLVFRGGTTTFNSRLIWFSREGRELGTAGADANYYGPSLSPDGQRVAVDISDDENNGDIWVVETRRRVASRFTMHPADESAPVWSSDGFIYFFRNLHGGGGCDLYRKKDTGMTAEELIYHASELIWPNDVSSDGRLMLFGEFTAARQTDLHLLSLETRKSVPYLATSFDEREGRFSPDQRFIAYSSNETGAVEVFVRPIAPSEGKWQISVGGGSMPLWSRDGKELFYISRDRVLMSVPVNARAAFEPGTPKPLFQTAIKDGLGVTYALSPDGTAFLIDTLVEDANASSVTLMQNWRAKAPRT